MTAVVPNRSEIAGEHTWAIESIFPSDDAWEDALRQVEAAIPAMAGFQGRLGDGASALVEWFAALEPFHVDLGKVYVYAEMQYAVDTADEGARMRQERAQSVFARALSAIAFAEPELLTIGMPTLERWMEENEGLRLYRHYFDTLQVRREHIRSTEVEEVLGMLLDPFMSAESTHAILVDTDLHFAPAKRSDGSAVELSQGNYEALLSEPDRELRRTAWEQYVDAHLAVRHTVANCLATGVKHHVFTARTRRYGSALEAALAPNHIPVDVFHNLIDAFERNIPTWHHYWQVRRRALGYNTLQPYDLWAPLTASPPSVPYSEAVEWIVEGMRPLGTEYNDVLRRGAGEDRWVDIYPNQRKSSGAFSTGWPGTRPFILMSYTDDVFSLSTLAHELGHSMHSYLSWTSQPMIYADYGIFIAEVASNFNQALVRAHLLDSKDDADFQIALIEEAMANYLRYFFIMPTLARFELEIHQRVEAGDALTAEGMIDLMARLFREGYGGEVEVDDERVGIRWAEFPIHMYGNFYVWQYATGISAASALAYGVLSEGAPAAERYLSLLRAGDSLYPLDALQQAGVDMTSPAPVDRAFAELSDLVERLSNLVDERNAVTPPRR